MSTETTSKYLKIIIISRFLHSLTEGTILFQLQKKKLKRGRVQKNTEGRGTPSFSDRKAHFILEIKAIPPIHPYQPYNKNPPYPIPPTHHHLTLSRGG